MLEPNRKLTCAPAAGNPFDRRTVPVTAFGDDIAPATELDVDVADAAAIAVADETVVTRAAPITVLKMHVFSIRVSLFTVAAALLMFSEVAIV